MKIFKNLVITTMVALTLATGTLSIKTSAASNEVISSEAPSKQEIIEKLTKYNVPEEQQVKLLEKLDKDELWDSLNPAYQDTAVEETSFSENVKIKRFPDGSIVVLGTEELQPIQTRGSMTVDNHYGMPNNMARTIYSFENVLCRWTLQVDFQTYISSRAKKIISGRQIRGAGLTQVQLLLNNSGYGTYEINGYTEKYKVYMYGQVFGGANGSSTYVNG